MFIRNPTSRVAIGSVMVLMGSLAVAAPPPDADAAAEVLTEVQGSARRLDAAR